MLRHSLIRSSRSLTVSTRLFSISARTMAEGDLGAPQTGSNAFSKREKASEDMYVRDQEMQKLRLLKQKLKDQQEAIEDLHKDIDKMLEEDKGSKN